MGRRRVEEILICHECGEALSEPSSKVLLTICFTYLRHKKRCVFIEDFEEEHKDIYSLIFELEQKKYITTTEMSKTMVSAKPNGYQRFEDDDAIVHYFCLTPYLHEGLNSAGEETFWQEF